jgi:hypothetical protein
MPTSDVSAIQAIQAILAPALGISAVGLLLLGLTNRYSTLINRIRLLNSEKRNLARTFVKQEQLEYRDNMRFVSIGQQIIELLRRARMLRNAVLSMQIAIAMFVVSSATIGLNLFVTSRAMQLVPLIAFVLGMFAMLAGIVWAAIDVRQSFRVILIEVEAEE